MEFNHFLRDVVAWTKSQLVFLGITDEDRMSRRKKRRHRMKCVHHAFEINRPIVSTAPSQESPESRPASTVMIYQSELDYISRCILDYKNIETGGQLFGFWTATGIPVVLYAIGPGRNANHQSTFFNQDLDYLLKVGNHVLSKYGLQHIGEWHSHHQLGLARPSGHDDSTMVNNIRREHLRRFLLCIGNCTNSSSTLNAFSFHEDHGYNYVQSRWSVKDGESPFRRLIDQDLEQVLIHPRTPVPNHGNMLMEPKKEKGTVVDAFEGDYWLSCGDNKKVLVEMNKYLKVQKKVDKVSVQIDKDNKHLHITVQKGNNMEKLYFPAGFPKDPVQISVNGFSKRGIWNFNGNILKSFIRYYEEVI